MGGSAAAGGRMWDEEDDGDDGAEVGDEGRVWGENVMEGWGGGSSVVDDEICTISVSIYAPVSQVFHASQNRGMERD